MENGKREVMDTANSFEVKTTRSDSFKDKIKLSKLLPTF